VQTGIQPVYLQPEIMSLNIVSKYYQAWLQEHWYS